MSEDNTGIDIPSEFHSFDSKKQFDHCIECDKYLLDESTEYFIEKAVKKYDGFSAHDVIFEYAICMGCAERMRNSMSRESMKSLEQYFMQNLNLEKRMDLMNSSPFDPNEWLNECMITGKEKSELNEYQIFAHCKGTKMVMGQMPYLVSGETLEAVAELLSAETLDELDDFSKRHFGPPPELAEDLPFRRVVMI